MEKLPDEVLSMIFENVPAHEVCAVAPHVCVRWARVSRRRAVVLRYCRHLKRLRHRPQAIFAVARLPDPRVFFSGLNEMAARLRELTVHADMPLENDELTALARLPHLRHLDVFARSRLLGPFLLPVVMKLSSLVINDNVARGVFRGLPAPSRLHALHMYGRSLHYPRRELKFLLNVNRYQLSALTLRCNELTDAVYEVVAACANLKSLQLYSCWLMTRTGAQHQTKLRQLHCLHLTGARMVRNKALAAMISQLPSSIEDLALSASWFGDEHVAGLCGQLPGLRVVELWRCRATSDGLVALTRALPALEQLDTDLPFEDHHEEALICHPNLRRVRCRLTGTRVRNKWDRLQVLAANAKYSEDVLRGDGEGYRADLLYYWMQGLHPDTLPPES